MALKKEKFEKYLRIENNKVYTKVKARVSLDLTEYKDIEDESGEEIGIEEVSQDVYEIPGYFLLEFPDESDSIQFYFPYPVYLISTENVEEKSDRLTIEYEENDVVFYAQFKKEQTDIRLLDKMFENGIKYLSNDLGILTNSIWKQLSATINMPYHHIETILSQLYIKYEDNQWKPVRLTKDQEYKKEYAVNTKKSTHNLNNTLGFLYGYSNDALLSSISNNQISDKEKKSSSLEKLISGEL
jgi:hypothetical protein